MRSLLVMLSLAFITVACDDNRVYEKNKDLTNQQWLVSEKPSFDFTIDDTAQKYNLYFNVRNEESYPKANLYFTYHLNDSTGKELQHKLLTQFLFDQKTGEPLGSSGLGDIYDHQVLLLKGYQFKQPGKYNMTFEQYMRIDTLPGVIAVGLRVEKIFEEKK